MGAFIAMKRYKMTDENTCMDYFVRMRMTVRKMHIKLALRLKKRPIHAKINVLQQKNEMIKICICSKNCIFKTIDFYFSSAIMWLQTNTAGNETRHHVVWQAEEIYPLFSSGKGIDICSLYAIMSIATKTNASI